MPHFDGGGVVLRIWCVGVGGSVLGLGCLLLEKYVGRHYGRGLAAVAGLFLCVWGALLSFTGHPVIEWVPVAALGGVSLVAWAAYSATFLRFTRRMTDPKVIWAILLIASPLYATYVASDFRHATPPDEWFNVIASRDEIPGIRLVTDQGRQIKLYRFVLTEEADEAEQQWVEEGRLECHIIRTGDVDPASNCHGWVFTGGRYAIHPDDVGDIVTDNGYQRVETPRKDDLILYRDDRGAILHTGVVLEVVNENLVLIESKWGPLGRYLHPPEFQPYGTNFGYYRSSRDGHQVPVISLADKSSTAPQTVGNALCRVQ